MISVALFSRLSEVEKIQFRQASSDRIGYLAQNGYLADLCRVETAAERERVLVNVKQLCDDEFSKVSAESGFGLTWRY